MAVNTSGIGIIKINRSNITSEYTCAQYIGMASIHFGLPPMSGAFTKASDIGMHSNRFAKKKAITHAETRAIKVQVAM